MWRTSVIVLNTQMCGMWLLQFLLLLWLQQTGGALLVTAPVTHQTRMGTDVTIPCAFTVNAPPIDQKQLAISWYFQGKEILRFVNETVTPADPRMSLTGSTGHGSAGLSVINITIPDGGIYKCSVVYTPDKGHREVRLDIQAPPWITMTDKLVLANKERVLRSSISGFYPVDINIQWLRDGETLDNVIVEKPQRLPDGTYSVTSSVTVTPTEEDRGRTFSCRVQHESLTQPLQEDFTLVYGAFPSIHISSLPFKRNVEQGLVCSVSGFYPEPITVRWFLNGTQVKNAKSRRINSSAVESVYQFLPTNENWGLEITCEVEHETLSSPRVERLLVTGPDLTPSNRMFSILAAIVVVTVLAAIIYRIRKRKQQIPKVQQPMQITFNESGDVVASLSLFDFRPKDITVTWSYSAGKEEKSSEEVSENPDGTFAVTSNCIIPGHLFKEPQFGVKVKWNHPSMEKPDYREISVQDPGFPWRPHIEEISPLIIQAGQETRVTCKISGYFPDNLTVTWLEKKGEEVTECLHSDDKYNLSSVQHERMADNTFTCSPCLSFTPTSAMEDLVEFICRVQHPSLQQPIEMSTGTPQVKVAPQEKTDVAFTIQGSDTVLCSVSIRRFYPSEINITWSHGNTPLASTKRIIQTNDESTFDATSECVIPWEYFQSSVGVAWTHPSLQQPGSRTLTITDFPWRPHIGTPDTPNLTANGKARIQCRIEKYFPDDVTVTWHTEGDKGECIPLGNDNSYEMDITRHGQQPDNTYSCTASLLFTPMPTEKETQYICEVTHPSLKKGKCKATAPFVIKKDTKRVWQFYSKNNQNNFSSHRSTEL